MANEQNGDQGARMAKSATTAEQVDDEEIPEVADGTGEEALFARWMNEARAASSTAAEERPILNQEATGNATEDTSETVRMESVKRKPENSSTTDADGKEGVDAGETSTRLETEMGATLELGGEEEANRATEPAIEAAVKPLLSVAKATCEAGVKAADHAVVICEAGLNIVGDVYKQIGGMFDGEPAMEIKISAEVADTLIQEAKITADFANTATESARRLTTVGEALLESRMDMMEAPKERKPIRPRMDADFVMKLAAEFGYNLETVESFDVERTSAAVNRLIEQGEVEPTTPADTIYK